MAYSYHTIVCRFDSPWIEWKDILDALITLPEQDSHKSHDEMLQDIMKPNFRSGNLKKLGRVRKNWLERFFVLVFNTGLLEYYTIDGAKLKDVRTLGAAMSRYKGIHRISPTGPSELF